MYSFRKSLVAIAGLLVIVVALAALLPLSGRGQGKGGPKRGPRNFYLTQAFVKGDEPLTACAEGFHMASLWEIHDPSNLSYDTALGFTKADSGFGPPTGTDARGWVRTGFDATTDAVAGRGNCNAWTTGVSGGEMAGTAVSLSFSWADPALAVSPWTPLLVACGSSSRVWCVQD